MHILIAAITAIAGLIWALAALQRAGFNLHRVRLFGPRRIYADKPLYSLTEPLDVAALLLLAVAKCEGAISAEQKQAILEIYRKSLHVGADAAADLLLASSHLLRDEVYLVDVLPKVLEKSSAHFSAAQIESLVDLMRQVATLEGPVNTEQEKLILAVRRYFGSRSGKTGAWA